MSPERWQQIEEIFQDALDLPWSEREKFVAEKCVDDPQLKAEVEKLLLQFEDASSFIETPALSDEKAGVLSSLMDFDEDDPMLGNLLGSYRIEREIGRGGMGAVYEAIRADGEFRRKAAIKIVKRGMDTDFILRRFRNERQILATLEHPYITRLLDGGTTDDGRPYFVMDYIEGLPLYRYCDKNRLTIKERLNLFTKICEAVEYAHQNLVIHRDLKPSNILVSNDGTPRLLDFGIAKLLNPELASDTLQPTATAMRMMTIDYASPEQINGEKVTFSTDIYSLGVILFELLTGHRPYRFPNRTPHEIARVICEEPPSLPSNAINRTDEKLPVIHVEHEALTIGHLADLRKNSPDSLQEELRGNLDNITIKALNKLPENRYESVKKFRADIEKHLSGQTISAPFYIQPVKTQTFQSADKTKLIAVLPLKLFNFSAAENTDENYLSLGLADAIISRLTNVRDFTVRPTSSILGYEKSEVDSFQAGRELGVDFVLEGRITKSGAKFRVSLQMLDVKQGAAIWAGQFDENSADILALEDAISEKVAEALVTQVTGDHEVKLSKRGTDNPQAYEAYLKGRFYWNQFTPNSLPKAIEQFQKAVELDPNFALAHVGVADFYIWANIYGLIPSLESYQHAEAAVNKALEINDQLGEAYATLGLIKQNQFDWLEGENLYPKAIELSPNYPNVYEWYSAVLIGSGKAEQGLKILTHSEELDPLSLRTKTLVAWTKYQAHEFQQALAKADELISLDSNYPQGHLQRGYILTEIGDADEAVAEIEKGMSLMPDSALAKYYYCFALAAANRQNDARQVYDDMKNSDAYVKPMFLGLASVAVGEFDEAFKYLNIAADEFDPWLVWLGTESKLKPIHSDKRYLELLKRTKNPIIKRFEAKANEAKSIAVLPLQFIGEAPTGDDYLSIGLADAMITRLSQVRRIVVRPTNAVLRFAETQDSFAAGRELGVDYVLNGMIRPVGKRIRISAQLLDIQSNTAIWSEKFDEEFHDVLDLEDLVAEKVAKLLIPQLTAEEQQNLAKRNVKNVEAYEAYLRGRYHLYSFTPDNFETAISYFEKAIEIDPNYALAYVALSDAHFTLTGFASKSPSESFPLIEKFARKAIELDDKLGDAYANLGMVEWYKLKRDEGEKLLKRGLELSPNQLNGYVWYSVFLSMKGKKDEALAFARKAYELDPISGFHQYHHIWVLYHSRKFELAVELIEKAVESVPNFAHGQAVTGWIFRHLNRLEESVQHSEKAYQLSPETPWIVANLAATYAKNGEREKALELLQKVESNKTQYVSPYCLAQVYLNLGDKEKAIETLEKSVNDRDVWFPWIATDAELDSLRNEPKFIELTARLQGKEKLVFSNTLAEKSIAVLPFQFIGEAETGEMYLSMGLADAMITKLSQIRRIIVRPTTSILKFAEFEDAFAVGKELKVDHILCGTIRQAGGRIRLSAQLLDLKTNAAIWAESFEENFTDILELEHIFSEKVAHLLVPQLTGEEQIQLAKRGTNNPKAFENYLRGRYYFNTSTEEGFAKAFVNFHNAIAEDENYAHAYVGLADYYAWLGIFAVLPPQECFQSAIQNAKKAVELDENLAEAHAALGFAVHAGNYDWSKAEYHLSRSLELNPNYATAFAWFSAVRFTEGRFDEGLDFARRAINLDPLTPYNHQNLGWGLYFARRFEESVAQYRKVVADFPNYGLGYYGLSKALRKVGKTTEALQVIQDSKKIFGESIIIRLAETQSLAANNNREAVSNILRNLSEMSPERFVSHYHLALIFSYLGEKEKVFSELEKAYETKDYWLNWLAVEPVFDFLRDDERYQKLLEKIGYDVFFGISAAANRTSNSDETIHQSNVPTKIFTTEEAKIAPAETKPNFFQRHKYKFILAGILAILFAIGVATGVITVDFNDRRFEIEKRRE